MTEDNYRTTVARRLATCRACPDSRVYPLIGRTCGKLMQATVDTCGCIVGVKARIISMHCPQGKWENGTPINNATRSLQ